MPACRRPSAAIRSTSTSSSACSRTSSPMKRPRCSCACGRGCWRPTTWRASRSRPPPPASRRRMRAPPGRAEQTAEAAPAVAQRPASGVAQELLTLQRTAGNRAVGAYLARAPVTAPKALAQGRRGNEVAALQSRLNQLSDVATALDVDGIFGPITAKAVREFKAKHSGLPAGASVDADTDAAISEALTHDQDQTELARKLFTLGAANYE